jgi:hypothetical protein
MTLIKSRSTSISLKILRKMSLSRLEIMQERFDRRTRVSRIPLVRLRDRQNPVEWYNALEFKLRYHMYKDTAIFITNLISPELSYHLKRGVHIPPVVQFCAVLRFYATGGFQMSNADIHQMSQPTICHLVKRVSTALAKLRPSFIKFPRHSEATAIQQKFYGISGFPGKSIQIINNYKYNNKVKKK